MGSILPVIILTLMIGAAGCSNIRESLPERTATEQLLISTAADRAIEKLDVDFAPGTRVWFDVSKFEAYDEGYVIGSLRAHLLTRGAALVPERTTADVVVEVRSGALSINESSNLVGMPAFEIPIPLAGMFELPEIALLKRHEQVGIAKLALSVYDATDGHYIDAVGPAYGLSWSDRWSVLGVGWTTSNVDPEKLEDATPSGPSAPLYGPSGEPGSFSSRALRDSDDLWHDSCCRDQPRR